MENSSYKRLGDFIELVDERNRDLSVTTLLGLSISKQFIPSVANTIGTNMKTYKIIRKNQFACSVMQVRRDGKMPVALLKEFDEAIISQAYPVFQVIDETELLPEYLMMWFTRSEFDREATFHAVGGVRGSLEWEDFLNFELPIPSIKKQQQIVAEYNTVTNRINLNNQLNQNLEKTAQALYKHWFVDFEFPCLPKNYRFSEQVNLPDNFESVLTYKRVGGLPIPTKGKWFTYVIVCEDNSLYNGMTKDLYRRFYEHYIGEGSKHTKTYNPLKVIHWEEHKSQEEARENEEKLKTGFGRTWLKRQIEKAGGIQQIINGLPAPKTQLRTAGEMVYNEELEKDIPVGWSLERLENVSKITMGQSPKGESYNEKELGIPLINGPVEFGNYFTVKSKWTTDPKKYCEIDDLILCVRGSTVGKYVMADDNYSIGRGVCSINSEYPFFNRHMVQSNLNEILKDVTGSTFPNLDRKSLESFLIVMSENCLMNSFENSCSSLFKTVKFRFKENQTLQELQSLLLAKMTQQETKLQAV